MTTKPVETLTEDTTRNVEEAERTYQPDAWEGFVTPMPILIDKAIAHAHKLQKMGKITDAVEKWRAIATLVEDAEFDAQGQWDANELAAQAWFTAGHLLESHTSSRRKGEEAIAAYDKAIRLRPEHVEAYIHRGKVKNAMGHYEAALADLNTAIRLKPDSAAGYTARGFTKGELGDVKAAFADYEEALRLDPQCAEAYYYRGFTKLRQGIGYVPPAKQGVMPFAEAALADLDEALRLNPEMPEVYHVRGGAKFFQSQFEEALADYDEAIRLAPWQAPSYTDRGQIKEGLGQREEALADYEAAIRADPEFAQPYTYRALEKFSQGDSEEAIADLKIALELARAAGDETHQRYAEYWLESLDESAEDNT